jgi:hypothetical protein
MKITKITVSFEGTINLGNYQNIKVGATAEAEIEDGDLLSTEADIADLYHSLRASIRSEVDKMESPMTESWLKATSLK